ncbi:MAG: M16 family metallopeptidase [Chitinophagales bacterium]
MVITRQLSNGATVLVEEIPYVHSAAVGVFVKVGSRQEDAENNGISHFIEHMLFKGTRTRSARDIAEVFEEMGGQLNAYTSKESTCFYARVLDENIYQAMDILFDMLFNSMLNEKDLDVERGVIIEEINMYEDSPDELVHDVFIQTVLSSQPLGRPILGYSKIIESMDRETIMNYYRQYYNPSNMIIAVAGNVNEEEVIKRIEGYKGYDPDACTSLIHDSANMGQGLKLLNKKTEQVQICLGVPGISYLDDNRHVQTVMNSILGGGMSSRLFQKIREEKGLAYSVYSYPSTYRDVGTYTIYVGTGPTRVREFFATLKDELTRFIDDGVSMDEVSRTQKQIKASIYLGLESIMTRMNRMGKSQLMYGRVIDVEEVIEKIFKLTPDMVQNFAQRILAGGNFSLASIGEADALKIVEEEFNRWTL